MKNTHLGCVTIGGLSTLSGLLGLNNKKKKTPKTLTGKHVDYEVGWLKWADGGGVKIISHLSCLRDQAVCVTSHINNVTGPNFPGL